ncbi:MAG: saccharopine dehydrogenase, partial [Desulfuromusa sp.]|nr:saccharopine dehydrogenase [Desulfuromusa sp.]
GQDSTTTAMAYTVGTPLAVAVKLIALGHILPVGVRIPTSADIYLPILDELSGLGIKFIEQEIIL